MESDKCLSNMRTLSIGKEQEKRENQEKENREKENLEEKLDDKHLRKAQILSEYMDSFQGGLCVLRMHSDHSYGICYSSRGFAAILGVANRNNESLRAIDLQEHMVVEDNGSIITWMKENDQDGAVWQREYRVDEDKALGYRLNIRMKAEQENTESFLYYIGINKVARHEEQKDQIELKKAYEQVKNANEAKTVFLSRMSHDMRTPMNGIIGLTTLTLERKDLPREVRQNLEDMDSASKFLLNLINDTLDMNKIQSQKLKLVVKPSNTFSVIRNIITCISPLAKEKKINFRMRMLNMTECMLLMDSLRVEQIFINLLSNAIKFTKPGGNVDFIINQYDQEGDTAHICITVRDNGIGMSREFLPKLFLPFEQENTDITQSTKGTGLGMAIAKNLVELMGGRITVESQPDQGTEFNVYLDLEYCDAQMDESPQAETGLQKLSGKNVLLCEDNALNARIAICMLQEKGMKVDHAVNGKQAVEMFQNSMQDYYDVILMDVRMPVLDGLMATRIIRACDRKDASHIPILAMTANAYHQDVEECLKSGMNGHIAKPINMKEMYRIIAKNIR